MQEALLEVMMVFYHDKEVNLQEKHNKFKFDAYKSKASNYIKQKHVDLKRKIDKFIITVDKFNIPLSVNIITSK